MNRKKYHFTLVELLVSLGVFSIMLVLFMQFFTSTQSVLAEHQKRTDIYANARVAQDFMTTLISATYYSTEHPDTPQFFFGVDRPAASTPLKPDALYFAAKTKVDIPGDSPIRFFGLQVPNPEDSKYSSYSADDKTTYYNKLMLTFLTDSTEETADDQKLYNCCFPEFTDPDDNSATWAATFERLITNLNRKITDSITDSSTNTDSSTKFKVVLAKNVTNFRVVSYTDAGTEFSTTTTLNSRPVIAFFPWEAEIQLSLLGDEDFEKWVTLKGGIAQTETQAARDFRLPREMTFTRRIFLGDRWKMESDYEKYP